jgi:hypothetical protein
MPSGPAVAGARRVGVSPRSRLWGLSAEQDRAILAAREKTNWDDAPDAAACWHRSTIGKVLRGHGKSKRRRREHARQTSRRYEWTETGRAVATTTLHTSR